MLVLTRQSHEIRRQLQRLEAKDYILVGFSSITLTVPALQTTTTLPLA